MHPPGGHNRTLRTKRLDRFADFNAPVKIGGVHALVMCIGEIRSGRLKEGRSSGAPFAGLAMTRSAFIHKEYFAMTQLYLIFEDSIRHGTSGVINALFNTAAEGKNYQQSKEQ